MRLVLKTTLKNIIRKPFRSFMVISSIFVCAVVALFCFDLAITEGHELMDWFSELAGTANMTIATKQLERVRLPEDMPDCTMVYVKIVKETLYNEIEGEYAFVKTDSINIAGVDLDQAAKLDLIDPIDLKDNETIITDRTAKKLNVKVGDVVTLHDVDAEEHDFKVVAIRPSVNKNIVLRDSTCLVTENAIKMLAHDEISTGMILIDFADDSKVSEMKEIITSENPDAVVITDEVSEETQQYVEEIIGVFVLLFVITFLLVIFITASICERIVSERMSFIGTLRSLGMSSSRTARILLLENIIYALVGSIPGIALFIALRPVIYGKLYVADEYMKIPSLSPLLPVGVLVGAVLIECIIPLKSMIKALKVPIRDIIFDNRDTEYKFSKVTITIGSVLLVVAVVTAFFTNIFLTTACVLSAVVATAFLFPLVLKLVSDIVVKISLKLNSEKWALSGREVITKKSTVASGVLCATSATMCILIFVLANNMIATFDPDIYNCDVIVTYSYNQKRLSFIERLDGVHETEKVYRMTEDVLINGDEKATTAMFYGVPQGGYKLFGGLANVPEDMADGSVCVEKTWANNHDVKIGDTVKFVYNPNGLFPIEEEYEVVSFFIADKFESLKTNFAITESDFIKVFHDDPVYLMVRCDDPEATSEKIETYAGDYGFSMTKEEVIDMMTEDNGLAVKIFTVIIFVAIFMTCLSLISNQLIGFDGRKKECAVMISTSMRKRTLAGVLFREMLITSVTASSVGAIMASFICFVIKRTVANSEILQVDLNIEPKVILIMWLITALIFALTVLFPINSMRKMKLSEQLKYE
ncbi:MAG: ABC transporter permease [Clostridiales bacterium]|nr:ABC transporter permease [Clostridiales bacterium]